MQSDSDPSAQKPETPRKSGPIENPDFNRPVRPIGEVVVDPEFPRSAVGEFVDIGGYAGVVVELVKESLKVRSSEGVTKSFNANGLRRIYGPVVRYEPPPPPAEAPRKVLTPHAPPAPPVAPPAPPALEPDFSKPVRKIVELVRHANFPQNALGEHVEIADYIGVVVQIVNRSLKVRAETETTRSYNADALRKLYGK